MHACIDYDCSTTTESITMYFYLVIICSVFIKAARNAFKGEESLEMLENDWSGLNLQTVFAQTLYTIQPLGVPQCYLDMVPTCEQNMYNKIYNNNKKCYRNNVIHFKLLPFMYKQLP